MYTKQREDTITIYLLFQLENSEYMRHTGTRASIKYRDDWESERCKRDEHTAINVTVLSMLNPIHKNHRRTYKTFDALCLFPTLRGIMCRMWYIVEHTKNTLFSINVCQLSNTWHSQKFYAQKPFPKKTENEKKAEPKRHERSRAEHNWELCNATWCAVRYHGRCYITCRKIGSVQQVDV